MSPHPFVDVFNKDVKVGVIKALKLQIFGHVNLN